VSAARISCLVNALESVGMVVLRAKMEEVRCTYLDQRYHVPIGDHTAIHGWRQRGYALNIA